MNLDVGSSGELRGDVNVDLINLHLAHDKIFVRADAQYLPFAENVFKETTCYHVIEHVENPSFLLKELIRVTKNKVTVKCPYRFSLYAKSSQHKHYFNKRWFRKQLSKMSVIFHAAVNLDRERDILKIPLEITVRIYKLKTCSVSSARRTRVSRF